MRNPSIHLIEPLQKTIQKSILNFLLENYQWQHSDQICGEAHTDYISIYHNESSSFGSGIGKNIAPNAEPTIVQKIIEKPDDNPLKTGI